MTGGKWFAVVVVLALLAGAWWIRRATGDWSVWSLGMIVGAVLLSLVALPKPSQSGD